MAATSTDRTVRGVPGARSDARRSVGLALTSLITAMTALVLTALVLALCGPLLPATPPATQITLVRRFYAVANALLVGPGPHAFDPLLAPAFIDHEPDGPPLDRAGLAARLAMLGRAAPGLQLQVGTIVADDAWVAVQVTPSAARGDPTRAATTDLLQLAGGRIVGYWPGRAFADLPHALPPLPLALGPAPKWVSLNRIVYAPDATLAASGPELFLVERGRLVVRLSGAAAWFVAARPDAGWRATVPTGQTLTLNAGDALYAPTGVDQTQRNFAAEPAAATSLAIFPTGLPAGSARDVHSPVVAALAAVQSASNPARLGAWTAWPGGVWVDVLADWFAGTATGPCLPPSIGLSVVRFALAPGAALPAQTVAGVALLAHDDAWLVGDPPAARAGIPVGLHDAPAMTEQGLGSVDGRLAPVRNLSREPLRLILATLTSVSAEDAACRPADPPPAAAQPPH